jgi:D-sedoheptulose 7-phosphate isomerase
VEFLSKQIQESLHIKESILDDVQFMELLEKVCHICLEWYKKGGKLLFAGNGGSAADAEHIAGELVSKFYFDLACITRDCIND